MMDGELERLKATVSLVRLVESSGVELKRQGKDYFGRCPFHEDKTPSLSVMPEKNLWRC
jgi:DNA primase